MSTAGSTMYLDGEATADGSSMGHQDVDACGGHMMYIRPSVEVRELGWNRAEREVKERNTQEEMPSHHGDDWTHTRYISQLFGASEETEKMLAAVHPVEQSATDYSKQRMQISKDIMDHLEDGMSDPSSSSRDDALTWSSPTVVRHIENRQKVMETIRRGRPAQEPVSQPVKRQSHHVRADMAGVRGLKQSPAFAQQAARFAASLACSSNALPSKCTSDDANRAKELRSWHSKAKARATGSEHISKMPGTTQEEGTQRDYPAPSAQTDIKSSSHPSHGSSACVSAHDSNARRKRSPRCDDVPPVNMASIVSPTRTPEKDTRTISPSSFVSPTVDHCGSDKGAGTGTGAGAGTEPSTATAAARASSTATEPVTPHWGASTKPGMRRVVPPALGDDAKEPVRHTEGKGALRHATPPVRAWGDDDLRDLQQECEKLRKTSGTCRSKPPRVYEPFAADLYPCARESVQDKLGSMAETIRHLETVLLQEVQRRSRTELELVNIQLWIDENAGRARDGKGGKQEPVFDAYSTHQKGAVGAGYPMALRHRMHIDEKLQKAWY